MAPSIFSTTAGSVLASGSLFVVAAAFSLVGSAVLVVRIERVGARLGSSEALLGLLAAVAANGPEITTAVTAAVRGQRDVGAGVALGSNAFNVAALMGLGALVAGRIVLHRRVVVLHGALGLMVAAVGLAVVADGGGAAVGLGLSGAALALFVAVSGSAGVRRRLPVGARARRWVAAAVADEESELRPAIHPRPGDRRDAAVAVAALVLVVAASVAMEHAGTSLGSSTHLSPAVLGGLVLAAVTSIPNAVAAVYLARRGRGAAVLSETLNSNNLNVVVALLVPAVVVHVARPGAAAVLVAGGALAMTSLALVLGWARRGLGRRDGAVIVAVYLVLVALLTGGVVG